MSNTTWKALDLIIPAYKSPTYTKRGGKRIKKVDSNGNYIFTEKIIPKERPRFSAKVVKVNGTFKASGHAHSSPTTALFEKWIRKQFFDQYPGNSGVYVDGNVSQVHKFFMGCRKYGSNTACTDFRSGQDFKHCKACAYRRKNLSMSLKVFLKDERHLDLDNVVKIVLDALEKTFFYNDSQFVHKDVRLFPNSDKERLEASFSIVPTMFTNQTLVGAYPIKNLSVEEASEYITTLYRGLKVCEKPEAFVAFVKYLRRTDSRKYVTKLLHTLLENDNLIKNTQFSKIL